MGGRRRDRERDGEEGREAAVGIRWKRSCIGGYHKNISLLASQLDAILEFDPQLN
jgi:hypothetical protein